MKRKAPVNFILTVPSSVFSLCKYQRGYHWMGFRKIWHWCIHENLSGKSNFGQIRTKTSNILYEDLSAGYFCRVYKIAIKVLSSIKTTSGWQESSGGKNIMRTRNNITLQYIHCLFCCVLVQENTLVHVLFSWYTNYWNDKHKNIFPNQIKFVVFDTEWWALSRHTVNTKWLQRLQKCIKL